MQIIAAGNVESEPVWIIEDDPGARSNLEEWLSNAGFRVVAHTRGAGMMSLHSIDAGVICLDLGLHDVRGLDLLARLLEQAPGTPIIALAPEGDPSLTHAAMRAGAYDVVAKPVDPERLEFIVRRALDRRALVRAVERLSHEAERRPHAADALATLSGACTCETLNLRELERMAIDRALKAANGSVGKAAKLLGMGRATLYRRLAEIGFQAAPAEQM